MKRPVINPARYAVEHTPEQVRRAIATLMRDGRDRTAEDVARAIKAKVIVASRGLARMQDMGLLRTATTQGTTIYRRATQ